MCVVEVDFRVAGIAVYYAYCLTTKVGIVSANTVVEPPVIRSLFVLYHPTEMRTYSV